MTAAVIRHGDQVLIAQRPSAGCWVGCGSSRAGRSSQEIDLAACLRREICEELGVEIEVGGWLGIFRHGYTHFRGPCMPFLAP